MKKRVIIICVLVFFGITLVANAETLIFIPSGQTLSTVSSRAISLGDFDGDGDLDAFVSSGSDYTNVPNTVWLNDGSGYFTDSGQTLGNSSSEDAGLGDFDSDGDLDAFVINQRSQPNRVWLNDGNGHFTDSGQLLGNSLSSEVDLGDLDGDGDLDAFVANGAHHPQNQPNRLWLNDGTGTFIGSGQAIGNSISSDVCLGDLDSDGDLDAFVANRGNNKVWFNDGNGSFTDNGQLLGSYQSLGLACGDVDDDGDLDAFTANALNQPDKVWLNDGSGYFTDSGQNLGADRGRGVALKDLDRDGDLDAFVANALAPDSEPDRVWLNDGSGTFTLHQSLFGPDNSVGLALGDIDFDGDQDAVVANSRGPNWVWLNVYKIAVNIDIKPGSDPNCFNSDGNGVIPVAILSSPDFDASSVDPFTVKLDGSEVRVKGKSGNAGALEDINADGLNDLIVQIIDDNGYTTGDTLATLEGFTFEGVPIIGSDSICITQ